MMNSNKAQQEQKQQKQENVLNHADDATTTGTSSKNDDDEAVLLSSRINKWKIEQEYISKQVVILPDDEYYKNNNRQNQSQSQSQSQFQFQIRTVDGLMKHIVRNETNTRSVQESLDQQQQKQQQQRGVYYGGVDVSFPVNNNNNDNKNINYEAVAVYVIIDSITLQIVYKDYIYFIPTIPYIPNYLAYREVQPLISLIKKQQYFYPNLTPIIILVDGNGILHQYNSGLACYIGINTNISTIGVGKTLYLYTNNATTTTTTTTTAYDTSNTTCKSISATDTTNHDDCHNDNNTNTTMNGNDSTTSTSSTITYKEVDIQCNTTPNTTNTATGTTTSTIVTQCYTKDSVKNSIQQSLQNAVQYINLLQQQQQQEQQDQQQDQQHSNQDDDNHAILDEFDGTLNRTDTNNKTTTATILYDTIPVGWGTYKENSNTIHDTSTPCSNVCSHDNDNDNVENKKNNYQNSKSSNSVISPVSILATKSDMIQYLSSFVDAIAIPLAIETTTTTTTIPDTTTSVLASNSTTTITSQQEDYSHKDQEEVSNDSTNTDSTNNCTITAATTISTVKTPAETNKTIVSTSTEIKGCILLGYGSCRNKLHIGNNKMKNKNKSKNNRKDRTLFVQSVDKSLEDVTIPTTTVPIQTDANVNNNTINNYTQCTNKNNNIKSTTTIVQNPIYISIGHQISLSNAIEICLLLSITRIPEPIRQADLIGRELLRTREKEKVYNII